MLQMDLRVDKGLEVLKRPEEIRWRHHFDINDSKHQSQGDSRKLQMLPEKKMIEMIFYKERM